MLQKFDERNKDIKVWINDKLHNREDAKISVFDSLTQGGDAVWEGIRVYDKKIFCLDKHLDRLMESAKSMDFENIPKRSIIIKAIMSTLKANKMFDETHIRLTLSRGEKITSGMNPKLNQFGCTLIVLAEWKPSIYNGKQLKLITSNIRRNSPLCLDSKIHHNNLINNILAKIEANHAGVDDAIMLDLYGFVAETNATNVFMIKEGTICTPYADACLPGITRGLIVELCKENNIPIIEKNISVTELYNADQVFTTGTMGELAQVIEIDKRKINNTGPLLNKLKNLFKELTLSSGEAIK
jgi:branched-chain amino acid aminotransferase